MIITIDLEKTRLSVLEQGQSASYELYGAEAFQIVSREWLKLGWNLGHWSSFSWMGRQLLQLPDDILRMAEAIWRLRPSVIVETGVYDGGSTLLFASLCRLMGHGRVISVESEVRPGVREAIAAHGGGLVTLLEADSSASETGLLMRELIRKDESVFVFLDSDHSRRHVAAELLNFAPLVTRGSYLVVADSNLPELADLPNGEPAWREDHPGVAVEEFLETHPEFTREQFAPAFEESVDFTHLSYFRTTWLTLAREEKTGHGSNAVTREVAHWGR